MSHDTKRLEALEKELVWQFFGRRRDGFFIEVGANDPRGGSQTWLLEQNGWRGILVEPLSGFYGKLVSARPRSKVWQAACSAPDKRGMAVLHVANLDGFSTLQPQRDSQGVEFNRTETVPVVTLDDILEKEGNPRVDFVSLDVEGGELEVLRGFSLEHFQPSLVLIEDCVRNLDKHRAMTARGYKLVKRTVLNNWYVPREAKFTMASPGERLELFRKMYLATPLRRWRLAVRRRRAERRPTTTGEG
jgi:FkbM family methyltransferase